jgi:hypothetical protein
MAERGVPVDYATVQRWVVTYSPLLEAAFHRRKRPVWVRWQMDETSIKGRASGATSTMPWINRARPWTVCARHTGTKPVGLLSISLMDCSVWR